MYLAASWIALEDGSPDSGPLRYYAGSHKIPPFLFSTGAITAVDAEMPRYYEYMQRELERRGIKAETFVPKIGDVFIWHSQLYHGGEPIKNPALTRRSLVTHYWRAQDVPRRHGSVGPHRYYFRRPPQRVDAPVETITDIGCFLRDPFKLRQTYRLGRRRRRLQLGRLRQPAAGRAAAAGPERQDAHPPPDRLLRRPDDHRDGGLRRSSVCAPNTSASPAPTRTAAGCGRRWPGIRWT